MPAGRDGDVAVGVVVAAVKRVGLARDGLAQRGQTGHRRVWLVARPGCLAQQAQQALVGIKSGKPWPRLMAPCSAARADMTVKMAVPCRAAGGSFMQLWLWCDAVSWRRCARQ